ncbi:MAG: PDZ domain-containing protein [Candidatus Eisenbacteria bacterium]|uniref:PDZ domain-containing protein n=1 Tax=Eiseniibacteriota bacterium TaxID=2212470 RepID=A0A538UCQ9_UNCEI|nr:MAG: PDZ domain-containing protein [Candidatus Eisenbacteria bacterium]
MRLPPAGHAVTLVALVLVAVGIGDGRASLTPQAQAIVDHYVAATGGAAALAAEPALHTRGRIQAAKLSGTVEQWTQIPDRLATRLDLGTLRLRMGYDGHVAWRTDLSSRRVQILEGKDLEAMASDAYFENEMWARPDQGGGQVTFGTTSYRDGQAFHSLVVTPPLGPLRRLWFSEKTGLITRVVTRKDQVESETWRSEYQVLAGRKRATLDDAVDQSLAFLYDEAPVARVFTDSAWVAAGESTRFAPPEAPQPATRWLKSQGVAQVPFRYGSRHVWIKVSINGAPPADFLLDTGCSATAIDRGYAERIGLGHEGDFGVQGMGGHASEAIAPVRSITVSGPDGDGVTLRDFKVGVLDLADGAEAVLWRRASGLLGADFLSRFAVEIDYDHETVAFHDSASFVYHGTSAPIDIRLMSGIPTIPVRLDDGCEGQFLVDVGNSFGMIVHGSLVKGCRIFTKTLGRKEVRTFGGGIGSGFQSWLCRLDTLRIGPYAVAQPIAGLTLSTHGMVGSEDYGGNLGNGVLQRFRCTFDYAHRKLYLDPGKRFAEPDRYSRIGAYLIREPHRVLAWGIVHGSAADEAGLKEADVVVAIDGRPATSYTPEELDHLFVDGEVGSTHTLEVLRDFKPTRLTVTLQDVI